MGVCALCIGIIMRIVAYQSVTEENTPEWVYDLDSVGNALCTSFAYLLCSSVCRHIPHIKLFHFAKSVSVLYLFIVSFDACKEVVGRNTDNSWQQVAYFCITFCLILFFQVHVYRNNTNHSE